MPSSFPGLTTSGSISSAVAVALGLSVAVGLAVGAVTALRTREDRIMAQLRETERSVTGSGPAVGTALVMAEVALAVILLPGPHCSFVPS